MGPMREVEAGNVHAHVQQLPQTFLAPAARTEGADDLGLTGGHAVHHHVLQTDGRRTETQSLLRHVVQVRLSHPRRDLNRHHGDAVCFRLYDTMYDNDFLPGTQQLGFDTVEQGLFHQDLELYDRARAGEGADQVRHDAVHRRHGTCDGGYGRDEEDGDARAVLGHQQRRDTRITNDHYQTGIHVENILGGAAENGFARAHGLFGEVADKVKDLIVVRADFRIGANRRHDADSAIREVSIGRLAG
mmetsp:Transcript_24729/g.44557  ORF Transcript_24729/g.44557 Transcript_24729/m.44557 type:complete len:245 (+) Transcript_24729:1655-2389(+)